MTRETKKSIGKRNVRIVGIGMIVALLAYTAQEPRAGVTTIQQTGLTAVDQPVRMTITYTHIGHVKRDNSTSDTKKPGVGGLGWVTLQVTGDSDVFGGAEQMTTGASNCALRRKGEPHQAFVPEQNTVHNSVIIRSPHAMVPGDNIYCSLVVRARKKIGITGHVTSAQHGGGARLESDGTSVPVGLGGPVEIHVYGDKYATYVGKIAGYMAPYIYKLPNPTRVHDTRPETITVEYPDSIKLRPGEFAPLITTTRSERENLLPHVETQCRGACKDLYLTLRGRRLTMGSSTRMGPAGMTLYLRAEKNAKPGAASIQITLRLI